METKCKICGEHVEGGQFLQANVNERGVKSEQGVVVCSKECAEKFKENLSKSGKPIEHWSRITGYYQNLDGWNKGKIQEIKDRQRYGV